MWARQLTLAPPRSAPQVEQRDSDEEGAFADYASNSAHQLDSGPRHTSGESAPVPSGFVTPPEELESAGAERHTTNSLEWDFSSLYRASELAPQASLADPPFRDGQGEEDGTCLICLQRVDGQSQEVRPYRVGCCGCPFHAQCAADWLRNGTATCPNCRAQ